MDTAGFGIGGKDDIFHNSDNLFGINLQCLEVGAVSIFQKLCGKLTNHKYRKLISESVGIQPVEYHYRCRICRLRFWSYEKRRANERYKNQLGSISKYRGRFKRAGVFARREKKNLGKNKGSKVIVND